MKTLPKALKSAVKPKPSVKHTTVYDRAFNPYRLPKTPQADDLVNRVLHFLSGLETSRKWRGVSQARKRARRKTDQQRYERQVAALISDVAVNHLSSPDAWIRVPRRKQDLGAASNYKPTFITEKFVDVMDDLSAPEMDFLVIDLGSHNQNPFAVNRAQARRKQTRIRATDRLNEWITERNLRVSDFGLDPSEEVIYLKGKKQGTGFWAEASLMPYKDTDKTREMRADLQKINAWLAQANLDIATHHPEVNLNHRRLRRIFNEGSWESHGRFYGGFWIDLPGEIRMDLLIDGELTADLDFGQMNPRLLYAEVDVRPHFQDAYAVPGLELHREGVKKLMNSLIGASKPLSRFPKEVRKLLPYKVDRNGQLQTIKNVDEAVELITEFHRLITHKFCMGLANRLMYRESEIMNSVLLTLIDEGITALPIHDGLLVAQSKAERARVVMLETFKTVTGIEGVVSISLE